MARVIVIVCSLWVLLVACKQHDPDHVIPGHVMASILAQMHEADAHIGSVPPLYIPQAADSVTAIAYAGILKRHGYTQQDFHKSMTYYRTHPDSLDLLYKEVVNVLNMRSVMLDQKLNNTAQKPGAPSVLYEPAKHDSVPPK
jgi:hypothetical protein